ncbi:hypothetical protein Q3G72_018243 [Acer saccharum]|nr:hypothetical protein Q3G72_018243 [Acer saccharum]
MGQTFRPIGSLSDDRRRPPPPHRNRTTAAVNVTGLATPTIAGTGRHLPPPLSTTTRGPDHRPSDPGPRARTAVDHRHRCSDCRCPLSPQPQLPVPDRCLHPPPPPPVAVDQTVAAAVHHL